MTNTVSKTINKGVSFIGGFCEEGQNILHTTNNVYQSFCRRYVAAEVDDIRDNHDQSEEAHDQFIESRLLRMSRWAEKFPQLKRSIEAKQAEILQNEYSFVKENNNNK